MPRNVSRPRRVLLRRNCLYVRIYGATECVFGMFGEIFSTNQTPPEVGMISKGLQNIVVGQTALSLVEGEKGQLIYHGYDIGDLAQHASYEEVAYLLWNGAPPDPEQLQQLRAKMASQRALPDAAVSVLRALPPNAEPMDALRTGVSAVGAAHPKSKVDLDTAIRLTSQVPTILATFHRLRQNLDPVYPRADLDHAGNYLYMLTGDDPTHVQSDMLGKYLVLLADHGMNASTFTARVVTSTASDMYSAITAAIGALKGPLHGGAPSLVLDMLDAIGTRENIEPWMRNALAHKERLMGFGHRVYKTTDPRAEILRDIARTASDPKFFELAQQTEETGLRLLHEEKPDQRLYTNVEFYSAAVMHAVGLPRDLFTPTFAVSRTAGWTAHVLEQAADNRLIRPDVEYVGPMGLHWQNSKA
jgi:citrate synthase